MQTHLRDCHHSILWKSKGSFVHSPRVVPCRKEGLQVYFGFTVLKKGGGLFEGLLLPYLKLKTPQIEKPNPKITLKHQNAANPQTQNERIIIQ